jgi:uncharacterized protein YcbK (DUF882 family)
VPRTFTFTLIALLQSGAVLAQQEPELEEPESASAAEPEGAPPSSPEEAKAKASGKSKGAKRKRSGKPVGYAVFDEKLRRRSPPPPSGNIHIRNLFRQEELKVNIYNRDGSYNTDALKQLSHLLRCKRTDTEIPIEPRLFTILSHVYDHFGERRIEVTSGYRNQRKTTSNHYRGSASDIMVNGVPPKVLRGFVESLDAGGIGVGIYPASGFVHVDVRPPPSYRWIDYSPTDRNDPNRRPNNAFKLRKKRLAS